MNAAAAQLLPDDVISEADQRFLECLVAQAADCDTLDALFTVLAEYLEVRAITLVMPGDRPPDAKHVVVVSLHHETRWLGDLYAALPDQIGSVAVATRLAFFAPVVGSRVAVDR